MTISVQGASLLATLFPISLLIVIVEARAAGPIVGSAWNPGDGFRRWFGWMFSFRQFWQTLTALSASGAIAGAAICAWTVCIPAPLSDPWNTVVWSCAWYQILAVYLVSLRLLAGQTRERQSRH